eukprot:654532-Rhodomonas_salina.1
MYRDSCVTFEVYQQAVVGAAKLVVEQGQGYPAAVKAVEVSHCALIALHTIWKHVRKYGVAPPRRIGRAPKLPAVEEAKIIAWIKLAHSVKLSTSRPIIKSMVNILLEDSILQHFFPLCMVTDFWYYSFRKLWQGVLG